MTAKETVKAICEALIEKKAQGIEVLHVERLTELTEYFVICSASSTTQVKALADNVEWHLKYDHDEMPHHTEGYESAQWMLLDYGCAVLHVFMPEARKFYNLENLWKDGTPVSLEELGIEDKIRAVVRRVYRGRDITVLPAAKKQIERLTRLGFAGCPVCIAKTQYSFSDDPTKLGAPEGFTVTVKDVKICAGAGFIVVLTGDIMTMPGLPRHPAAERIDVDDDGRITGLF